MSDMLLSITLDWIVSPPKAAQSHPAWLRSRLRSDDLLKHYPGRILHLDHAYFLKGFLHFDGKSMLVFFAFYRDSGVGRFLQRRGPSAEPGR